MEEESKRMAVEQARQAEVDGKLAAEEAKRQKAVDRAESEEKARQDDIDRKMAAEESKLQGR